MDIDEQMARLLKHRKAVDMEALREELGGCSQRSVFRYLERVGYLVSVRKARFLDYSYETIFDNT